MEKFIILKKLINEKVIVEIKDKNIYLKANKNINLRWLFESANKLKNYFKVHIILN